MKQLILISVAALAASAANAGKMTKTAKFDPPDLNYEFQLHQQFSRSKNQPASQAKGIKAQAVQAPNGVNENYALQKGETLWTLSEMLYGDGQYWPRVWAQNKAIANPHLVRPGHQLQFVMGSEDATPAFRFSEEGDQGGVELAAGPANPIVEIPPPEVPPKPILKVPTSFPEWQSVYKKRPDNFLDDSGIEAKRQVIPDQIYLRGYVQEKSVEEESIGMFLENDNEAGLPITNQYVYVKVKKGQGQAGMKILVVTNGGKLKRLNQQWDPEERPWLVQVTAEIELRESVPAKFSGSDKEKYEAYRALVLKTTGLSAKQSFLIPGALQTITLDKKGPSGRTQAQVIGSEKHGASALFAPGDLVFLDKGSNAGLEVGNLLDVFADRTIRRSQAVVVYSPVTSATIKVVKVSGKVATAVLLTAYDSVQQGDIARELTSRNDGGEKLDDFSLDGPSAADDDVDSGAAAADEGAPVENLEDELDSAEEF